MPVRMARGTISYLKKNVGNLCVQLRAVDRARAVAALESASDAIWRLPSTHEKGEPAASYVSEPMLLPDGPAISIDMPDEGATVLRKVVDIVIDHALAAGLTEAEVGPPRSELGAPFFGGVPHHEPGVRYPQLLLRSRRPSGRKPSISPQWVDPMLSWLLQDSAEDEEVWVGIVALAFRAPASTVRGFLDPPAGGIVNIAAGEASMRHLYYSWGGEDAVLQTLGTGFTDGEVPAVATELQQIGRSLAPFVDYCALGYWELGHLGVQAACARGRAPSYPRHVLPDVFSWQILAPEHTFLLGGLPPRARRLEGGRIEVSFGDLEAWREGSDSHEELRRQALAELGSLVQRDPHIFSTRRGPNDWGTLDEAKATLEGRLPGGTWVSSHEYRVADSESAIEVQIAPNLKSIQFLPAGQRALEQARRLAASFQGYVPEHPAGP